MKSVQYFTYLRFVSDAYKKVRVFHCFEEHLQAWRGSIFFISTILKGVGIWYFTHFKVFGDF